MFFVRIIFMFVPFFCGCYCRRAAVQDVVMNRDVAKLIKSYIEPLSEKFPNHELEIQVDMQGPPVRHISRRVSRRKIHLRKPHKSNVVRIRDESKVTELDGDAIAVPIDPSTYALATNPPPTPETEVNVGKKTTKADAREPVYKDELQRALDELERKIGKNLLKESINHDAKMMVSNLGPVSGSSLSVNRIIELIKKGVQFQKHAPNTEDGNLEWMQIKIPKSIGRQKE